VDRRTDPTAQRMADLHMRAVRAARSQILPEGSPR
jgi:hypothetical protein